MKKLILISSLVLVALVLTACGGSDGSNELLNTTWQWTSLTESEPASQSVVPSPENYTVVFNEDGTFNATVDCNQVSGSYELEGNNLTVMPGPSTMAECGPDSLYDLFLGFFGQVTAYEMGGDTLVLIVGDDAAKMFFENAGPA
jgi:heat shock protein HslJ